MDPAGLLISIATIACTLDELSETYNSASNTLSLIRSQIKILETGAQRIQEWLHFTDPTSKMQIMGSLRDAVATVNSSLQRLQDDITSISHTGPKTTKVLGRSGSNQWLKAKFTYNESRMRKHLTDVRECASLMHFTLNVCQLPFGQADHEARELQASAKTLHRAQTSARRQRNNLLQKSDSEPTQQHSDDYNSFMKHIMEAEADLPDEEPPPEYATANSDTDAAGPPPPIRLTSANSIMTARSAIPEPLNVPSREIEDARTPSPVRVPIGLPDKQYSPPQQASRDRDELYLPDAGVGMAVSTSHDEVNPQPSQLLRPLMSMGLAGPTARGPRLPDYFSARANGSVHPSQQSNAVSRPPTTNAYPEPRVNLQSRPPTSSGDGRRAPSVTRSEVYFGKQDDDDLTPQASKSDQAPSSPAESPLAPPIPPKSVGRGAVYAGSSGAPATHAPATPAPATYVPSSTRAPPSTRTTSSTYVPSSTQAPAPRALASPQMKRKPVSRHSVSGSSTAPVAVDPPNEEHSSAKSHTPDDGNSSPISKTGPPAEKASPTQPHAAPYESSSYRGTGRPPPGTRLPPAQPRIPANGSPRSGATPKASAEKMPSARPSGTSSTPAGNGSSTEDLPPLRPYASAYSPSSYHAIAAVSTEKLHPAQPQSSATGSSSTPVARRPCTEDLSSVPSKASVYRPSSSHSTAGASVEKLHPARPQTSASGSSSTLAESGRSGGQSSSERASAASPADSAYSISEKMAPLAQSLSSLSVNQYVNVELDQPPVQPYEDRPPIYSFRSRTSSTATPREPRSDTIRSSMLDEASPKAIRLARESRTEELQIHLQQGANVNEVDPRTGRTAIMEAARFRCWDTVRLLHHSGARLHLKDADGNTALHLAAAEGDANTCQILLDSGAHLQDCNKEGHTPLELAAGRGHTEAVLCLVNSMKSRKTNDQALVNAFLEAVKLGDVPTAQAFIVKDVKPRKIKESWKPIACAAQSGSLPMLSLMLAQKCSLKEKSPSGWTPLHFAARHGQQPMLERLLAQKLSWDARTKKAKETALHVAAASGHTSTGVALVAHRDANVTMRDSDNLEPIHHSVRQGDVKLTAALLDRGAKLNSTNKYGWKGIHIAAAYGHVPLTAECMTRGISIEEKLMTPSFKPEKRTNAAARRGYWAEIRWPHSGARPLHLALEFGHDDVVKMLISGGARIDEGDSRGWRPLHHAAFSCRPEMVELLLQKGATPDAKTVDNYTALQLGFREYGLTVDQHSRFRVVDLLETAMAGRKKSKLKSLTGFMTNSSSSSRTASQRNLAWHTAQLAEALYQAKNAGDDDDAYSLDGTSVGSETGSIASGERESMYYHAQTSSSSVGKA